MQYLESNSIGGLNLKKVNNSNNDSTFTSLKPGSFDSSSVETIDFKSMTTLVPETDGGGKPNVPVKLNYQDIKDAGFKPQGYDVNDDVVIISAYKNGSKSRLYIYDRYSGKPLGIIALPTDAHVGGTAIDEEHNTLFVTDNKGKIKAYNYEQIIKTIEAVNEQSDTVRIINLSDDNYFTDSSAIIYDSDIDVRKVLEKANIKNANASTCCFHDGALYVATFSDPGNLVKFNIEYGDDGSVKTTPEIVSTDLAAAVQGITFYHDENSGKDYLITSQSYGHNDSCLKKYEVTDSGTKFVGQKILDTEYCEGISCDSKGNITSIHENGGPDDVQVINISELDDGYSRSYEESWRKAVAKHNRVPFVPADFTGDHVGGDNVQL